MQKFILFFFLFIISYSFPLFAQVDIIPKPNQAILKEGTFNYTKGVDVKIIRGDEGTIDLKNVVTTALTAQKIAIVNNSKFFISLNLIKENKYINDGYDLNITPTSIELIASSDAGLFYGIQSLLQLFYQTATTKQIGCVEIKDQPILAYRGLLLDVSRHFFSVDVIKQYLDRMAKLKMNQFHWHLTDDQGWRIEIKKYPKLTEVGGCRTEKDSAQNCGYYTQEQVKEIVLYAKARFINIIPEIDIPSHTSAMIASYPYLGCNEKTIAVPNTFGEKQDILCPSDSTLQLLKDVMDEICQLFPSPFIHIGGNMVDAKQWKESPKARKIASDKGFSSNKFQSYFITQIEAYIKTKGKKCIVWGDAKNETKPTDRIIINTRGLKKDNSTANQGNNTILSPRTFCFLDNQQEWDEEKKTLSMSYLPINKAYKFNPFLKAKNEKTIQHVIGAQACIWTDFITTPNDLEFQTFPRLIALAETFWTPAKKRKKYWDFDNRLEKLNKYILNQK